MPTPDPSTRPTRPSAPSADDALGAPFAIGGVRVDPPTVLAPMAGVTDRDFRKIVKRIGGVGVVTMEFISSKMLLQGDRRVTSLLTYAEEERPLSIQIYGSDAATMADAARVVEERGADLCDINMGCPANKVLKGCAGAALMGDLDLARDIVRAVRRAISIPLTVKFRLGLDERRRNYLELGHICEAEGADAVAMHARTAKQMYRGTPAWHEIAALVDALSIPVLGNGDVRSAGDALDMLRATGCAGVMVGRGATRDPWIFRQIEAALSNGRVASPTLADRRRLVLEHFETLLARDEPTLALHKMRTFTHWYSHGLPDGKSLRRQIQAQSTPEQHLAMVRAYFDALSAERGTDEALGEAA
ncbi:MAG: tRNA dihydrouridine synthase DusB [Acidobacteriota bacterium]